MRVLWFGHDKPALPHKGGGRLYYNGGGWLSSMEHILRNSQKVELGIAYMTDNATSTVQHEGQTTFFPMKLDSRLMHKVKRYLTHGGRDAEILQLMLCVVDSYKPDVIHVFGTETCMGLMAGMTDVPVVIHLQGLVEPYRNALLPPNFTRWNFLTYLGYSPCKIYCQALQLRFWRSRSEREKVIIRTCQNFMGRTDWDRRYTLLIHPEANYMYCGEALRPQFYDAAGQWTYKANRAKRVIATTISAPFYKGYDFLLKTAWQLKNTLHEDFEWKTFGLTEANGRFVANHVKISSDEVSINTCGIVDADELVQQLLDCDCYVHTSYIDNSPNSVCEAQLLGVPVVACYVGGISSLIEQEKSGVLVPANDPYMAASFIHQIFHQQDYTEKLSCHAKELAAERHDKARLLTQLLTVYQKIRQ